MTSYLPVIESVPSKSSSFLNVYKDQNNTRESAVRVLNSTCFKQNFQSKAFGETTTVLLPKNKLLSNVYLTCNLAGTPVEKSYLPEGWMYRLIEYVEYSYGSNNILRLTPQAMWALTVSQAESGEKVKRLLELAGRERTSNDAWSDAEPPLVGCINIPLPHSSVNAGDVIPFDASIVTDPISITVAFKRADQVFSFADANAADVRTALAAVSMKEVYLSCRTSYMVDGPSDSVAPLVGFGGPNSYSYMFKYPGYYRSDTFTVTEGGDKRMDPVILNLLGVLPGSMQSIDLFLERITFDADFNTTMNKSKYNPLLTYALSDVELLYAGQCIFKGEDTTHALMSICDYTSFPGVSMNSPPYSATDQTAAAESVPRVSSWTHIQLSQFHTSISNLVQAGCSLNTNNLQVSFRAPKLSELGLGSTTPDLPTTPPQWRLHVVYTYQASLYTADGSTNILFQRPATILPSV